MKLLRPVCPLIAMDEPLLPFWGGVENLGGIEGEGGDNWVHGLPSDYGRVCEIKDLGIKQAAILKVKAGDALGSVDSYLNHRTIAARVMTAR